MEKPHGGEAPQRCPTTFIQTDAATFKELVQRLTGPHEQPPDAAPFAPAKVAGLKRLHERRRGSRLKLPVVKPAVGAAVLSPSLMAKLVVSPSTGFAGLGICDELNEEEEEEEEKAIKERRFYLHPSPRSRSQNAEPELLPLFPLTSPKTHDH